MVKLFKQIYEKYSYRKLERAVNKAKAAGNNSFYLNGLTYEFETHQQPPRS